MRAFIAVELNKEHKQLIGLSFEEVKKISQSIKLVDPHNLHLTLCFIGEIKTEQQIKVQKVMKNVAQHYQAFNLKINNWGSFKRSYGDILFLNIGGDTQPLRKIVRDLKSNLIFINPQLLSEKYHPHITIARKAVLNEHALLPNVESFSWQVNQLVLMESMHINKKLTYMPRYKISLSQGD